MNRIKETRSLINSRIFPHVRRKHHKLFAFGLKALTLTSFKSLNSNARQIVSNRNTAASKIYRLVSNPQLEINFYQLVKMVALVGLNSLVNIDFSTFCGFETLAFGVQTEKGRALPVWVSCLTYPIKFVGSQNLFILKQLKLFGKILGFWPRFVFDRGFAIPILIEYMLKEKIIFYVRVKAGQGFGWKGSKEAARKIGGCTKDAQICAYGGILRLIVSPPPDGEKNSERWYIITNDFESSREKILHIYRCRFEIEETFKDLKHIYNLKKFFINKELTFRILLWFYCLGFWLAWWCREKVRELANKHKKLSWFRHWWEGIQREIKQVRMEMIVAVPDG